MHPFTFASQVNVRCLAQSGQTAASVGHSENKGLQMQVGIPQADLLVNRLGVEVREAKRVMRPCFA